MALKRPASPCLATCSHLNLIPQLLIFKRSLCLIGCVSRVWGHPNAKVEANNITFFRMMVTRNPNWERTSAIVIAEFVNRSTSCSVVVVSFRGGWHIMVMLSLVCSYNSLWILRGSLYVFPHLTPSICTFVVTPAWGLGRSITTQIHAVKFSDKILRQKNTNYQFAEA